MNKNKLFNSNKITTYLLLIIAILLFCWASNIEYEVDKQNDEDLEEFIYEQVYLNE